MKGIFNTVKIKGFTIDELEETDIKNGILILETNYFDFRIIELYDVLDYKNDIVNI